MIDPLICFLEAATIFRVIESVDRDEPARQFAELVARRGEPRVAELFEHQQSLARSAEAIVDQSRRRSRLTKQTVRPAISKRNLLFYILPLKHPNQVWQWHVDQLRRYLPLFNGRRIVTVATAGQDSELSIELAAAVRAAFGEDAKSIEFVERPNDPRYWEAPALAEMLSAVSSTQPDEASFYFHAKGVRRPTLAAVRPWCEAIYQRTLGDWQAAVKSLERATACGIAIRDQDPTGYVCGAGEWHFAGNGFWFRHDALFGHSGWRLMPPHTHAAEAYLSTLFARDEVCCLEDVEGDVYKPSTWGVDSGRVSIIVTARNYGRYLLDCLESCFWQERPAAEIIYCDDTSVDDSLAIASRFAASGLKVLPLKENLGVVAARNFAASESTGDLLLFVDGDNILPRNYLAKMVEAVDQWTSFAYPDLIFFGQDAVYHRQPEWKDFDLWEGNRCDTCSLIRRDVFESAGGWIGGPWAHMEDFHLFLRASCFGAGRRANTALGYRRHGLSLTAASYRDNSPEEMTAAIERITTDCRRWAIDKFGRLPSRRERDLGVTAAAPRELAD